MRLSFLTTTTTNSEVEPMQSNAKRKALDMDPAMNPLLAAAKRAKKDKLASNKRKLLHNEDAPGGLLIVRAAQPDPESQPQATSSKPPSKKFRADSRSSRLLEEEAATHSDADLERDVRAMEDEADRLRRNSRAHIVIDRSLVAAASTSSHSMFQFPPPSMSKSKPLSSGRTRGKMDTRVPIAENETPQQQRNKRLRGGANARDAEQDDQRGPSSTPTSGHRRASSLSRGKRISTSYEMTGVITQPHNTVSEASFYKHIDADLPDVERVRQLLIWCSLRAVSTYNKPTKKPLPPLSGKAAEVLKKAQDEFVRALAEKRIDLNVHGSPQPSHVARSLEENEQNVRNRNWEVTYSAHIQRAQAEDEAWKKVSYEYDAYAKKLQASVERRKKALDQLKGIDTPKSKSNKAKRKVRATGDGTNDVEKDGEEGISDSEDDDDESWLAPFPLPHKLPPAFQHGAQLARSILIRSHRRLRRPPATQATPPDPDPEHHILSKLPLVPFKLDLLHNHLIVGRAITSACERLLDERFRILNKHLDNRMRSASLPLLSDTIKTGVAPTYTTPSHNTTRTLYPFSIAGRSHSLPSPPPRPQLTLHLPSPRTLLRTLTRVDAARPPAQIGDAARRAAREVQRAEESGIGPIAGERRVTLLPGMASGLGVPATPRKGTALGGPGTPGRRTPARERTPAR